MSKKPIQISKLKTPASLCKDTLNQREQDLLREYSMEMIRLLYWGHVKMEKTNGN